MVSTMENIVNSKEEQDICKTLGYEQVKKFSWSKMADETLAIYQSMLPKKAETTKIDITLKK